MLRAERVLAALALPAQPEVQEMIRLKLLELAGGADRLLKVMGSVRVKADEPA